MLENLNTYNAKIKFSYLGTENDFPGVAPLVWQIGFEYEYGTVTTAKVALNNESKRIAEILSILDLRSWEELPRKYARIKVDGKKVVAIGNVIRNEWLVIA